MELIKEIVADVNAIGTWNNRNMIRNTTCVSKDAAITFGELKLPIGYVSRMSMPTSATYTKHGNNMENTSAIFSSKSHYSHFENLTA